MPSNDPFSFLQIWALPLFFLATQVLILAACIFGAFHPSLRREFIWFALATVVRCAHSVVVMIPNFLQHQSTDWISGANVRLLLQVGNAIGSLSTLLYLVGFILLAVKARSLPPPRQM